MNSSIIKTKDSVKILFIGCGFEVKKIWKLPNDYWPDLEPYETLRKNNPWWLVQTSCGLIEIGPRKRVYCIDWSDTSNRGIITDDDVTKSETMVHAWDEAKLIAYLQALGKKLNDN